MALASREIGVQAVLWGRNPERVALASSLGLEATTNLGEAVEGADLVVFAVPVGVMDLLAEKIVDLRIQVI